MNYALKLKIEIQLIIFIKKRFSTVTIVIINLKNELLVEILNTNLWQTKVVLSKNVQTFD